MITCKIFITCSISRVVMLAALNNLEVKTADIENAYLTAPVGEKIWCRLGPEFGSDAGKKAVIVRALHLRGEILTLQKNLNKFC